MIKLFFFFFFYPSSKKPHESPLFPFLLSTSCSRKTNTSVSSLTVILKSSCILWDTCWTFIKNVLKLKNSFEKYKVVFLFYFLSLCHYIKLWRVKSFFLKCLCCLNSRFLSTEPQGSKQVNPLSVDQVLWFSRSLAAAKERRGHWSVTKGVQFCFWLLLIWWTGLLPKE